VSCGVVWPLRYKLGDPVGLISAAECQLPKEHEGDHRCEVEGEVYTTPRMDWERK
jgi:hypothetical protein